MGSDDALPRGGADPSRAGRRVLDRRVAVTNARVRRVRRRDRLRDRGRAAARPGRLSRTRRRRTCVPGSLVFTPTRGPVDLRHLSQWWTWTPGACWKHPEGPTSSIDRPPRPSRSCTSPTRTRGLRGLGGRGAADRGGVGVRRARRPRRRRVHLGRRGPARRDASWPTPGTGPTSRGAAPARAGGCAPRRSAASRPTATGSSTWPATCGSGPTTGGRAATPTTPTRRAACPTNPRGGDLEASYDPAQPQFRDRPQGDQGRLAPLRRHLLPALPARRAATRR